MARILRASVNLLYHQRISPAHLVLARTMLEFLSTTAAILVIYFVLIATGLVEPIADPGLVLAAWLFIGWYFGASGVVIAALTEVWEPAEKFIQPMQYLQLPLSGVFFMLDWLPDYAQKLLLLNPTISCFEMFRAGFFGESLTAHYEVWYLTAWSSALTIAGAAGLYHVRDRIQFN
jgi:capsular polysaccharide transport system permease protein